MNPLLKISTIFFCVSLFVCCTPASDPHARQVGTTPTADTAYAKGVSGAYAGLLDGHLILAGGANFPGRAAADGGGKRYYEAIYATTSRVNAVTAGRRPLAWQQVGVLPVPMAYGVTISDPDGITIIGGCNAAGGLTLAFRLKRQGGTLRIEELPPLPVALDDMAGARLGNRLYLVGGLTNGEPSAAMYAYDFNYGEWFACAPLPKARVQPVCAAQGGRLFVWGGYVQPIDSLGRVQGEACAVYTDGLQYDPQADHWSPAPAPTDEAGHPLTLTGGAAIPWGDDEVLAVGGVNRNVFLGGIQGLFPMPDYLLHEPEWYRFNSRLLVYSVTTGQWRQLAQSELAARAGASLVVLPTEDVVAMDDETAETPRHAALLLGGELKPGIRSGAVTLLTE